MIRRIVISVGIILILLWTLIPFYFLVVISLHKVGTRAIGYEVPSIVTLEHYKKIILGADAAWPYLLNSVIVCSIVMIIALFISLPVGYALSRWDSVASRALYLLFFVLRMIPLIVLVVPYFVIFGKLGLINTKLALIMIYMSLSIPLGVWLMKGFFDTIPKELEEAAQIDGATTWQVFWRVIVPVASPSVIVTGFFVFLICYIEYMYSLTLTSTAKAMTMPVYITGFVATDYQLTEDMLAASLIGIIPMIILYLFVYRYIGRQMTFAMVKG